MQRSDIVAALAITLVWGFLTLTIGTFAWTEWSALQNQRRVTAYGREAPAEIKATQRIPGRSETKYLVNVTWKDHWGAIRTTNGVPVSKDFFQKVEAGQKTVVLKHLPDEPQIEPVFVEDAAALESQRVWNIRAGLFAIFVGLVAGPFVFWRLRRRPRPRKANFEQ